MMRTGFSNLQGDEDEMQHRHAKALIDICKPVFETAVVLAAQYTSACGRSVLLSEDFQLAIKYCTMYRVGEPAESLFPGLAGDGAGDDDEEEEFECDDDEDEVWTRYVGDDPLMNAVTRAGREYDTWVPSNPAQEYLKSSIDANEYITEGSDSEEEGSEEGF